MSNLVFFTDNHSSVSLTAGTEESDGYKKIVFVCNKNINFISNDSTDTSLFVNFDAPVGQAGTIVLFAGETINDLERPCRELYVRGNGKPVPFRALGV